MQRNVFARINGWSTGSKLSALTFTLVASIFIAFMLFIGQSTSTLLETRAVSAVTAEAEGVGDMIDMFNRAELGAVEKFSRMFVGAFPGKFSIDQSRQVQTGATNAPVLQHDGLDINLNFSAVDKFTDMTAANATVFVKAGDDFVRISTSVKTTDGSRAVGTLLGRTHPGYEVLMKGQTYKGLAVLFGKPHVTEYVPIKDDKQQVIGALYVGVDISAEVAALKQKIKSRKIGASGYFFVVNAKEGNDYGALLVHPTQEGKIALDWQGSDGRHLVKDMLAKKEGSLRYASAEGDPGAQSASREKLAVFMTNKDWNWLIVGIAVGDEISKEATDLRNMLIGIGTTALLFFAGLLLFVVRLLVTKPLSLAKDAAVRIANGDLTARLNVVSNDEIGQLLFAMNGISEGLTTVVASVRDGTSQVATAARQIAAGNEDLSARTEQEASALEETASSMEELTSTVKQNAENAQIANDLSANASGIASKGGDVVAQVVDTMSSINDSSKKIVDIISVIDGIAFQTNILALNAAVEAARAGDQGRGFAVVAAEVRSLAQRSATAAKEIKFLINDSVDKVSQGTKLVAEAGATMNDIVASVEKVTAIMVDITAASREQSSGIEQVNRAIMQIDQVTQQNAALVEEAAAAARAMQDQSATLERTVSTFKIDVACDTLIQPPAIGSKARNLYLIDQ